VQQLARSGAHVIVGGRNGRRRAALAAEVRSAQPGARVDVLPLDLASSQSVITFAASVEKLLEGRRLDGLCNNAAVIKCSEERTPAGVEMTFATNALGPFHLTNCLLPLLSKGEQHGARARVVTVGSRLESRGWIDPKVLLEQGDMYALPQSAPKPPAMVVRVYRKYMRRT
jgi:NAD(P)-dependent dehydrogenase (short-subunit alcohol dehydrogenase family)